MLVIPVVTKDILPPCRGNSNQNLTGRPSGHARVLVTGRLDCQEGHWEGCWEPPAQGKCLFMTLPPRIPSLSHCLLVHYNYTWGHPLLHIRPYTVECVCFVPSTPTVPPRPPLRTPRSTGLPSISTPRIVF